MDAVGISLRRLKNLQLAGSGRRSGSRAAADVVRDLLAMQSQDYGPAKWAIAQRSRGLSEADVDGAVADGSILRTHVLRPTWHFVSRDDIGWLLEVTGPRVAKGIAPRLRGLGLDSRTLARCRKWISAALEGDRHLTRQEIGRELERRRIDTTGQRLPHILIHCELEGLVCSGRPHGKNQTYALLSERGPQSSAFDRDSATVDLVRRYLAGHGPATVNDLRWWSSLTVADIRSSLETLDSDVGSETVDGLTFWRLKANEKPATAKGALLLQTYDEFIVGYRDSRFIGDPRAEEAISAWKNRRVPNGLVLIDGKIAGHWRRRMEPRRIVAEVLLYETLGRSQRSALDAEAARLGSFLDRPCELEFLDP